jgi:hypothetical protein
MQNTGIPCVTDKVLSVDNRKRLIIGALTKAIHDESHTTRNHDIKRK